MSDLHRLHALFDELLEVPTAGRDAWFEAHAIDRATRAELERLLAADDERVCLLDHTVGDQLRALLPGFDREPGTDPIGRRIGPFRLRQRLGQGGMATVFLAVREDADFDQVVALKLLRRDTFSDLDLALFRRERQTLARLTHPNIARLIDGGVSEDGIPYLAMEHVDGVAITRWCREQALDLRARVALLAKVARAVAAAHNALIVHRDIKPSNVLVGSDGEPKLLDFGIAKLLHADASENTRSGLAPMTPEYAAPEQFSGAPITTATDVYALGVLLYELLTGARPARGATRAPSAQLAAVRAGGAPPSTLTRRVRGDLDRITLMAMAEEPERRYANAAALADDLERHLASQPILAHPPSAWYRTRKFVQRHRGGAAITALLLLGILASLALALWQARIAREETARANAVRDFVVDLLRRTTPDRAQAERPDIPTLVYTAAAALPRELQDQVAVRIELQYTLGNVLRHMRDLPRSEALLRDAAGAAATLAPEAPLRLNAQVELARTLLRKGDIDGAQAQLAPVLALPASRLPDGLPRGMLLKIAMAIQANRGDTDASMRLATQAIDAYREDCAAGVRCAELAFAEHDVGATMLGALRIPQGRALLESALARKRALPAPPISIAETLSVLAFIAMVQGEPERAEALAREGESTMLALGNSLSGRPWAQHLQVAEALLARRSPQAALALLEPLLAHQSTTTTAPCVLASTHVFIAQAQLMENDAAAALRSSEGAAAAGCDPDDRLLAAPLASLLRGRALAAMARDKEAAQALDDALRSRARFDSASANRQLQARAEMLRLAGVLGRHDVAQREARAQLAALDRFGAVPQAALRQEAEAALSPRPETPAGATPRTP